MNVLQLFFLVAPLVSAPQHSQAGRKDQLEERSQLVLKLANEINDATFKGDYGRVVDLTYPPVIKLMGGKSRAIQLMRAAMEKLKEQNMEIKSFKNGTPGKMATEGANAFVIVPTVMELKIPGGRIQMSSYTLGISPDGGKSWTFLNGDKLHDKKTRDAVLPKLPEGLTLPDPVKPVRYED